MANKPHSVTVTIPEHKTKPGMVIAQYVFRSKRAAERYAAEVKAHPTNAYDAKVTPGMLPEFDITAGG